MDYEWLKSCAIILITVVAIAMATSCTANVYMTFEREKTRFLHAKNKVFKKCDIVPFKQWAKVIDAISAKTEGCYPTVILPFADYVNGQEIECEYERAIDYGIAVGYQKPEDPHIDLMISFVFETESLDKGDAHFTAEQRATQLSKLSYVADVLHKNDPRFFDACVNMPVVSDEICAHFGQVPQLAPKTNTENAMRPEQAAQPAQDSSCESVGLQTPLSDKLAADGAENSEDSSFGAVFQPDPQTADDACRSSEDGTAEDSIDSSDAQPGEEPDASNISKPQEACEPDETDAEASRTSEAEDVEMPDNQ